MELEDNFEDNFFNKQCEALRSGIDTKRNYCDDMLEYDDLLMYLNYEVFHGDTDLMYEKLAEYFSDDYDRYCEKIIENWISGEQKMARPIREILNSDINYFEKKVNKYKNQQITIKKELKELKKNSAQNVDAILKKLEYLDNLNNTVIRHERLLEYLKNYAEKYFDAEN